MPSTNGLKVLTRTTPINDDEWLMLIEARRGLVSRLLDSFTLVELGDLECINYESYHTHKLSFDAPKCEGDEPTGLKTQGIFFPQLKYCIHKVGEKEKLKQPEGIEYVDGARHIWGLTRKNNWILATAYFRRERGYKERGYERVHLVRITRTDLATISTTTEKNYETMWEEFGAAIKHWRDTRKHLYEQAEGLANTVEAEALAYRVLTKGF